MLTSNGARLYVGVSTETLVKVAKVETFSEFGPSADPETYREPANETGTSWIVRKIGMAIDYGPLTITVAQVSDDPGQAVMNAAALDDADYSFRVALGNDETFDFLGNVLSARRTIGGANSVVRVAYMIAINSPIY